MSSLTALYPIGEACCRRHRALGVGGGFYPLLFKLWSLLFGLFTGVEHGFSALRRASGGESIDFPYH